MSKLFKCIFNYKTAFIFFIFVLYSFNLSGGAHKFAINFDAIIIFTIELFNPFTSLFLILILGLLSDALSYTPLGISSLAYAFCCLLLSLNRKYILTKNFNFIFICFLIFNLAANLLKILLVKFNWSNYDIITNLPFNLLQYFQTVLAFPILYLLILKIFFKNKIGQDYDRK